MQPFKWISAPSIRRPRNPFSYFYKCVLGVMFFYCALTHSQESQPIEIKAHTPRIALVLGGGGARGAAHIGVLELLEQEHVPITCMVGTSMGGLTAGAFAAGLSPTQMREKLDQADWADMFLDSADYSQMGYRNKRATK